MYELKLGQMVDQARFYEEENESLRGQVREQQYRII